MSFAQTALFIFQGPLKQSFQLLRSQRLQTQNPHARKQGPVNFKIRVFRRGADQRNPPILYIRQQHILLGFVKTMKLIDKKNGSFAIELASFLRCRQFFAQIRRARSYRVQALKNRSGSSGDQFRQCRLSGTGGTVQNQAGQRIRLNHTPQKRVGTKKMLLPCQFR